MARAKVKATPAATPDPATYYVRFIHATRGADRLPEAYASIEAANAIIKQLRSDPVAIGWPGWLRAATYWVVDEAGKVVDRG